MAIPTPLPSDPYFWKDVEMAKPSKTIAPRRDMSYAGVGALSPNPNVVAPRNIYDVTPRDEKELRRVLKQTSFRDSYALPNNYRFPKKWRDIILDSRRNPFVRLYYCWKINKLMALPTLNVTKRIIECDIPSNSIKTTLPSGSVIHWHHAKNGKLLDKKDIKAVNGITRKLTWQYFETLPSVNVQRKK